MKDIFQGINLATLCSWFGVTRQAYYQHKKHVKQELIKETIVLDMVRNIRLRHKRMGGRKLYSELTTRLNSHGIKLGRDCFFDLLRRNNLLIKPRKSYHITTNSKHWMRKYPNLIKDIEPMGINHILVSDITYWKIRNKHFYISFVTDAYSKMILGYNVAENMEAIESINALKMALRQIPKEATGVIHHSDRGSQYCSSEYIKVLNKRAIQVSMTQSGDPLENAIAERVNGIIKGEYLFDYDITTISEAKRILKLVVQLYNQERPHLSLNNMKPKNVYNEDCNQEIKRLWKSYYKKHYEKQQAE